LDVEAGVSLDGEAASGAGLGMVGSGVGATGIGVPVAVGVPVSVNVGGGVRVAVGGSGVEVNRRVTGTDVRCSASGIAVAMLGAKGLRGEDGLTKTMATQRITARTRKRFRAARAL